LQKVVYELRDAPQSFQAKGVASNVKELWVKDTQLSQAVEILNTLFKSNMAPSLRPSRVAIAKQFLRVWPITLLTIVLGFLGFALVEYRYSWLPLFTFTDMELSFVRDYFYSATNTYFVKNQWWRLVTPAFLHFGIWHILFNALALWELGRRLEFVLPRTLYCALFAVTCVSANLAQYWTTGPEVFGGLSGVVFGFLGAIFVFYQRTQSVILQLPKGFYVMGGVSLIALPLVLENVFGIYVANGAHVGGLLSGLAFALVTPPDRIQPYALPKFKETS
jgi:GlpG protein